MVKRFLSFILLVHCFCLYYSVPLLAKNSDDHAAIRQAGTSQTQPVVVPAPSEKAMQYYRSGNLLWCINKFLGILIPALFLFTGFSARIRAWAARLGKRWFFIIGIYLIIYTLIDAVLDFPLNYYGSFVRQHAYGLSDQTFNKWMSDWLKSLSINLLIGMLMLWISYWLLKRSPKRWWIHIGIFVAIMSFFFVVISPVCIDPLFNDYGPMKNKPLESQIMQLADRAGIHSSHIFEVNKSVDTKTINAFVTGLLNTRRIVVWDNTIARLSPEEVLFIVGHEAGHYVLGHVWKGLGLFIAITFLFLYLTYRFSDGLIRKFQNRFKFIQLSDIASLPMLLLLIQIFSLLLLPPANAYSRYIEREADRFGLELTQDNFHAATAFVKMQQENLANP